MSSCNLVMEKIADDRQVKTEVRKGNLDLVILRYMARRLHLMLRQIDQTEQGPVLYQVQERRGRNHRIVIYQQQELFQKGPLAFVGFISKRKPDLSPSILEAIGETDQKLVAELADAPGILSYSSMELPRGDWCNLVVLADSSVKGQIKQTQTHTYAAYELAHEYYEWIRLHSRAMAEGLDHMEMRLLKTKHYTFSPGQQKPTIHELTY